MSPEQRDARWSLTFTIASTVPLIGSAAADRPGSGGSLLLAGLCMLAAIGFLLRGEK